jgi:hypothetical protein
MSSLVELDYGWEAFTAADQKNNKSCDPDKNYEKEGKKWLIKVPE